MGILDGEGFGLEDASAIEIVHDIRNSNPIGLKGDYHPFAKALAQHPLGRMDQIKRNGYKEFYQKVNFLKMFLHC